jgi:aminoglycoside phosphotransferase (APT) family kinase protein
MERRRGAIIRAHEPAQVREHTEVRRAISSNIVDALVALHSVDVHAHGLEDLGKPAGFVTRQVAGWAGRWRKAQTEEVAEMERVARWLDENTPLDATVPTLVHGDFKLDNVMLDERDVTRIVGVFDWEMAAIGDPLVDLGILLSYWTHAAAIPNNTSLAGVTHLDGWFTRDEIVERYAARSGRNVSNIKFYEVFAVFKLAVVAGQIFYRFHRGQTADPRFAHFDQYVSALAKRAVALI